MPIVGSNVPAPLTAAVDIISSALRLVGVLGSGETASDAEASDAFLVLNDMLDGWNAERLMIFSVAMSEFPLTAGKQTYTFGPSGDFNLSFRPAKIQRYGIVNLNNPAQPLELPLEMLTTEQWAGVPVKQISSTLPTKIYDDQAFPLRNLSFWPYPQIQVNLRAYYWQPLSQFSDLTTKQTFPPGYPEALRYNLAVRLAPEFGAPLSPQVAELAATTKGKIKRMNSPLVDVMCDPAIARQNQYIYNWLSDTPVKH